MTEVLVKQRPAEMWCVNFISTRIALLTNLLDNLYAYYTYTVIDIAYVQVQDYFLGK